MLSRGQALSAHKLGLDVIHAFLSRSYWAMGIPQGVVARSLEHSLPFGL